MSVEPVRKSFANGRDALTFPSYATRILHLPDGRGMVGAHAGARSHGARMRALPAALPGRPGRRGARVLRSARRARRLQHLPPPRRGTAHLRHGRLRDRLLHLLHAEVRLLPELPDFTRGGGTRHRGGGIRAEDARPAGAGMSQHQPGDRHALPARGGPGAAAGGGGGADASDRLQLRRLRTERDDRPARGHRGHLAARHEVRFGRPRTPLLQGLGLRAGQPGGGPAHVPAGGPAAVATRRASPSAG